MSLDLLIINPGAAHGIAGGHAIYGDLGATLVAKEPPLWCRIIAGYVRDRGFSVRIIDQEAEGCAATAVATAVESLRPQLICVCVFGHQPSASTQQMVGAGAVAHEIKRTSSIPIIMVGGHVAALPERTLREEAIDYACNGEGPVTIVELLSCLKGEAVWPTSAVPGLVWRHRDGTVHNNPRAPFPDMADLHGDAWDLLPMHLYRAHNWQCFGDLSKRQPYASIATTFNCPYKCSFCCISSPFGDNRYRMRDPEHVVAEIVKLWKEYGVKTLKIVDEMFVLNPRHYLSICDKLIAAKAEGVLPDDINIWAYARVDTVKPEYLSKLKAAGFQWLALGIESGSKHVRDGADKSLRNDDIVSCVRAIQEHGINVIGNYIFGLRDDDLSTVRDTLALAQECNTEFANFYSCMAYPGSGLFATALEQGWTLPETWSGYSQHNADCRPLDTEHISAKEVLAFRDQAFETYFTDPRYLEMVERKFGTETLEHVKAMTTYKLKRKLLTGEIA